MVTAHCNLQQDITIVITVIPDCRFVYVHINNNSFYFKMSQKVILILTPT